MADRWRLKNKKITKLLFVFVKIGRRDSLESTWLPGESSPLAASANTSPFSSMSRIHLSTLSSASSK